MPPLSRTQFDIPRIAEALFTEPVRSKLLRAYAINTQPESPQELCEAIWSAFGQTSAPAAQRKPPTNDEVFRAAIRAIGSSARDWSEFLSVEPKLNGFLNGGPSAILKRSSEELRKNIQTCLKGQSQRPQSLAVLQWAAILSQYPDFGRGLESARLAIRDELGNIASDELDLPAMAIILSNPPASWPSADHLQSIRHNWPCPRWKAPGMGFAIASEFLRNLHWPGFKADRHIARVLHLWAPELIASKEDQARRIGSRLNRESKEVREFLMLNLAALHLTPPNMDPSQVDNLIWALGAMVEKKGMESTRPFLVARS